MNKYLLTGLIGIWALTIAWGQSDEREIYQPEVVIDALLTNDDKLGSEPGNFLRHEGVDWIGGVVPADIEVDENANIFIFDMGNDRIQVFDREGKYIYKIPVKNCYVKNPDPEDYRRPLINNKTEFEIAKDGSIYVLDNAAQEIINIDKNGNILKKYDVTKVSGIASKWFVDGLRDLHVDDDGAPYFWVKEYNAESGQLTVVGAVKITTKGPAKNSVKQKKGIQVTTFGRNRFEVETNKPNEKTIRTLPDGKLRARVSLASEKRLLNVDIAGEAANGDLFVYATCPKAQDGGVFRYDKTGALRAKISEVWEYWWKEGKKGMPLKRTIKDSMFADSKGNFYVAQLLREEGRLRVIRWGVVREGRHE